MDDPIRRFTSRVSDNPWVFDLIQRVAGSRFVRGQLARRLVTVGAHHLVLDIGGGTGLNRRALPPNCEYLCLDTDLRKLGRLPTNAPRGKALLADATCLPVRSANVDVVLCTFLSHHLGDSEVSLMLAESRRVLRTGGQFVFLDAVKGSRSVAGWALRRFDGGAFFRSERCLRDSLGTYFGIVSCQTFSVYHEYLLCVATKENGGEDDWAPS